MSKKEDNEKNTPARPSIKVSIPIEVYRRRMRKVQEEADEENTRMKEKEKDKNAVQYSEVNSTGGWKNQTDVSQEQNQPAINHPSVKPNPEYLGIPVGSFKTPRPAQQQNYSWSTNRPHPYRYQRNAARVQRMQRFHDLNNNMINQPQELTPSYRENWQQPPFTTNVPTTQHDPKSK